MRRFVDEENKIVYFQGDWPTVMGIPFIMKKNYPDYDHKIVNHDDFMRLLENYESF